MLTRHVEVDEFVAHINHPSTGFSVRKTLIRLKDPEMMAMLQSEPQLAAALSGGAFGCWDLFWSLEMH